MRKITFANFTKLNVCWLSLVFVVSVLVLDNIFIKILFMTISFLTIITTLQMQNSLPLERRNTIIVFLVLTCLTFVSRFTDNIVIILTTFIIYLLYLLAMFFTNFIFLEEINN